MTEFWLKNEDEKIEMLLPVSLPEYKFEYGNNIETVSTTNFGDINIQGHKQLSTIILSGFFPKNDYEFSKKQMEPMEYVLKIQSWIDNKAIVRLIIIDESITKVNGNYFIESIAHSETSESNGDINYVINLREYRKIEAIKVVDTVTIIGNFVREDVKSTPKSNTYTVVAGDSLSRIARKMYGDASKWQMIYDANKALIKNPNLIYPGQVINIPTAVKSSSNVKKGNYASKSLFIENMIY